MSKLLVSAYLQVRTLEGGHSDTVNTLAFSPNGLYLASGGDDYALIIWNVSQGRLLYRLMFRSAVDVVIWHPIHPDTVIVGCANGTLQQVQNFSLLHSEQHDIHLGARSTVHCMDYDTSFSRLAIGMGEEVHITREIAPNRYNGDVVLPAPDDPEDVDIFPDQRLRAIAVQFHDDGAALIVSYLAHGIICWNMSTCEKKWQIRMPSAKPNIGGSAVSPDHRHIVVYNLVDGLDLYTLAAQRKPQPKMTYKFDAPPNSRHRLQVQYIHEGHGIFCGTTTGKICIWESATGELSQHLPHEGDIVQAVAAVASNKTSCIATGSAVRDQGTYIKIWRAKIQQEQQSADFSDSVADIMHAVARTDRFGGDWKIVAIVASTAVAFTVCVGVLWVCSHMPWAVMWESSSVLFQRILVLLQFAVDDSTTWVARRWLDVISLSSRTASSTKQAIRQILREFVLFLFPELAGGMENEITALAIRTL